ncbi:MAG TPA: sulfide-quinone oxidoreductase [Saprospiraceae bacterium]|nr:sulfide-quinone oxidoreductase [Saprospiraceae bacterium]
MKTKIIILGGGFAGLRAYYRLNEYDGNLDIKVIDKRSQLLEKPSLPEVAFSGKPVNSVLIDLQPAVEHKKGQFIHAEVTKIDPDAKTVTLSTQVILPYDYLIIASGAIKDYDAIDGFRQYGYSMCDEIQATKLWKALQDFKGGNVVIGTAKSTFGHQVKAPNLAAPCEGPVGEAMFMIDHDLKERSIRDKSTISVFSPGKIFFEDVGDHVREKVGKIMKKHAISLSTDKVVIKITSDALFFEDGDKVPCDLAIIIPPYTALPLFKDCGLGDDAGFIPTDETMKHLSYDSIYAIGDINALAQPKLGHIAVHQADIAVSAILAKIKGEGEIIKYEPSVFCIMNMGGQDAILIYSDNLYAGKNDLAFHSPLSRMMKWSFDSYYYFSQGHMFPDFAVEGMEKFLGIFKEDEDKYIPFE